MILHAATYGEIVQLILSKLIFASLLVPCSALLPHISVYTIIILCTKWIIA